MAIIPMAVRAEFVRDLLWPALGERMGRLAATRRGRRLEFYRVDLLHDMAADSILIGSMHNQGARRVGTLMTRREIDDRNWRVVDDRIDEFLADLCRVPGERQRQRTRERLLRRLRPSAPRQRFARLYEMAAG